MPDGGARVMIVDDNDATAQELATRVRALGHEATVTTSWTDAVRTFDSATVDVVLMDAVMPTVDGFKLTRMLRARSTSYVPIVFVSAVAEGSARELGFKVGADDFLPKPVDPIELRSRLNAMLRIRRLTSDLESRGRELAHLASVDPLTGVANRRTLDERLEHEFVRSRRYGHALSVLMVDLDHFKRVNDDHGHAVGDELLRFVAGLLDSITRASDSVCRYGGEEFVVIAPETASRPAGVLAERIRVAVCTRSPGASPAGLQTVSIGVAGTDLWGREMLAAELLYGADMALYRAKREGRDRVCTHVTEPEATG